MEAIASALLRSQGAFPLPKRYLWCCRSIPWRRHAMDQPIDQPVQSTRNRLLELLTPDDFDRLRPHLEETSLKYRMPLYEAQEPIDFVYFPVTGVASLVDTMV